MKIAILGKTASRSQAPFNDPEWTIWGLGIVLPGGNAVMSDLTTAPVGRFDAWFEIHMKDFSGGSLHEQAYCEWLRTEVQAPVLTLKNFGRFPTERELPRDAIIKKYGSYFLRNTVSWAMAYALYLGASRIGLWGIDQTHKEEIQSERHGVQHFIHLAREIGVPVDLPDGCALLNPVSPYPADEWDAYIGQGAA